jgi:PhoPQ-activated pathogenicity-related protein
MIEMRPCGLNSKASTLSLICLAAVLATCAGARGTALDDYIAKPDANYSYVQVGPSGFDNSTYTAGYVLQLTSQAWRGASEVDHVVWKHWVTVIVPQSPIFPPLPPAKDTAVLIVGGGNSDDPAPTIDPQLRRLAAATRAVVVEMTAVPNQPLRFSDQAAAQSEDQIIAYSWYKYFQTGDTGWPVQLPMVKSVVRCLDAIRSFVASGAGGGTMIRYFVLTGGSKQGWTVWLTAAVDNRVKAIAPIVSDLLNMRISFAHQLGSYGRWADALAPYEDFGIFDSLNTANGAALLQIVDPFSYRDRLTMPKFIVNSTGDEFFVLDSVRFYLHDLSGETYLRHVPNADHYLTGAYASVVNGFAPYLDAFLNAQPRPRFSWSIEADGSIRVQTVDPPKSVSLWQASNPSARDFRLTTIGAVWQQSPLSDQGGGVYLARVPLPAAGWTAFFAELVYGNSFSAKYSPNGDYDYHFTTEVHVLPTTLPFPQALLAPVYRFWSPVTGKHFYTTSESEKSKLINLYAGTWAYEAAAYRAYLEDCDRGLAPVHRFWSGSLNSHFYTASEEEKQKLVEIYSHVWTYEGIAFYGFPEGQQPPDALPVHRFWSDRLNTHFYTLSETEKNKLIETYSYIWTYEGIAWYARAASQQ